MTVARGAELPLFDALRMLPLVLRLEEVAVAAFSALENHLVAHGVLPMVPIVLFDPELATGIEPVTSSLPRMCSTN
jgi:hypothetical protein